jgi:Tol biopolymer transport system component
MKGMLRAGAAGLTALIVSAACAAPDDSPAEGGETEPSAASAAGTAQTGPGPDFEIGAGQPFADVPEETHLRNVRQLTFEGENAEAYFSFGGTRLVFQRTPSGSEGACDQIFTLDLASGDQELVSTGQGRTTCSYFYPDDDRILYSSTHLASASCPAPPDYSRGYVWAVYPGYDIFVTEAGGGDADPLVRLTDTPGYDAEATISPVGDRIVFTSVRDGDLDLYSMALDGSDVRRLTNRLGYDGGAFYSPDGSKIVWRAHYPESEEEVADYLSLLEAGLIRPTTLEIWVADADGSNARQITDNGAANFGPYWHPSGQKIVFASNMDDPTGRDFDIYMIDVDGSNLERVTHTPDFDGFPVFSPDGRYFVWGSNRNMAHEGNTNVFIAEWVEGGGATEGAGATD